MKLQEQQVGTLTASVEYDPSPESPDSWECEGAFLGRVEGCRVGRDDWHWTRLTGWYDNDPVLREDGGYDDPDDRKYVAYPVNVIHLGSQGWHIELALEEEDATKGAVFVKRRSDLEMLANPARLTMLEIAESVVETWRTYLNGEVYQAVVRDQNDQIVECVGGFYREEDALQDAVELATYKQKDEEVA